MHGNRLIIKILEPKTTICLINSINKHNSSIESFCHSHYRMNMPTVPLPVFTIFVCTALHLYIHILCIVSSKLFIHSYIVSTILIFLFLLLKALNLPPLLELSSTVCVHKINVIKPTYLNLGNNYLMMNSDNHVATCSCMCSYSAILQLAFIHRR